MAKKKRAAACQQAALFGPPPARPDIPETLGWVRLLVRREDGRWWLPPLEHEGEVVVDAPCGCMDGSPGRVEDAWGDACAARIRAGERLAVLHCGTPGCPVPRSIDRWMGLAYPVILVRSAAYAALHLRYEAAGCIRRAAGDRAALKGAVEDVRKARGAAEAEALKACIVAMLRLHPQ